MKRLKIIGVFFFSILFSVLTTFGEVSAYTYGTPTNVQLSGLALSGLAGGYNWSSSSYVLNNSTSYVADVLDNSAAKPAININNIKLDIGYGYIPAGSLLVFDLRMYSNHSTDSISTIAEYPAIDHQFTILDKYCVDNKVTQNSNGQFHNDFVCTYWVYVGQTIGNNGTTNSVQLAGRWWFPNASSSFIGVGRYMTYVPLVSEKSTSTGSGYTGLTDSDKTFIQSQIDRLYQNGLDQLTAIGKLQAAIEALQLGSGATSEQLGELVEEQKKNNQLLEQQQQQDQKDREDMQSQVNESQSSADEAQEGVNSTSTSLIGAAVELVNVISSASPTDCKVQADIGDFKMGTLDFCSGKPDAMNPIISTCVLLVCFPIGWIWGKHILSDMLSLIESFNGFPMGEFD